jgi:hypothetical protein
MQRCRRAVFLILALPAFICMAPSAVVTFGPPCRDDGLLAWGQFSSGSVSPLAVRSDCGGSVTVPGVSPAGPGNANEIVGFSPGQGVALKDGVSWNPTVPLAVNFPPAVELNLKVWVLSTKPSCDFACLQMKMSNFLVWANDRLDAERTGIRLVASGAGWITDNKADVAANPTTLGKLVDFSDQTDADCNIVKKNFPAAFHLATALNIYLVHTVDQIASNGVTCVDTVGLETLGSAFVAAGAVDGTMLHELGHNLGLEHVRPPLFDHFNLMYPYSGDRRYVSEGQIFRMNYRDTSSLNRLFNKHPMEQRSCDDDHATSGMSPCPAVNTWIWPD